MEWLPHLRLYPTYLHPQIRAGRGLGVEGSYRSWVAMSKIPTRATVGDCFGIRTQRVHSLADDRDLIYLWLRMPKDIPPHSTVTLFARFRGLSTSVPRAHAV